MARLPYMPGWARSLDLSDAQLAGQSLPMDATTGFAGVAPLQDLFPNSRYYYALTLNDSPPRPHAQGYPTFTTFPSSGSRESFTFAFGSCFRPADENGGQIFHALEEHRQADNLRFLLMIGDQIYADAFQYNGIGKVACSLQEYRDVYAYTWSRPALRQLLANLPAFMTLDDHEVDDDWHWLDRERHWATIPWWDMVQRWLQGRPPRSATCRSNACRRPCKPTGSTRACTPPLCSNPRLLTWLASTT